MIRHRSQPLLEPLITTEEGPFIALAEAGTFLMSLAHGSPLTGLRAIQEVRAWRRERDQARRQERYGHHAPSSEDR